MDGSARRREHVAMKAIVQHRYGGADALSAREVARPELGARDVLVRVVAAGVDRGALHPCSRP